MKRAWLRSRDP